MCMYVCVYNLDIVARKGFIKETRKPEGGEGSSHVWKCDQKRKQHVQRIGQQCA